MEMQIIANGIIAGALYASIAMGFNLILSVTKFFNLAHGSSILVGAYATLFASRFWGNAIVIPIFIGGCASILCGFFLNATLFQTLRKKKASPMVAFVASLGVYIMTQALIAIGFTNQFWNIPRGGEARIFHIFGAIFTDIQLLMICSSGIFFIALFLLLQKTLFGKAVRAIRDDSEVAQIVGIHTENVVAKIFCIGSGLAGIGGIFWGLDTGIEPTMGLSILLKGMIAAIIGGSGSISGAFLGSYLLGMVENIGIWHLEGSWKDTIAFAMLLFFLLFRPQGLLKK